MSLGEYEPEIRPATDAASIGDLPGVTHYVLGALCELGDDWHERRTVVDRTERLLHELRPGVEYDNSALWCWALDALSEHGYLERRGDEYRLAFDRSAVRERLEIDWEMCRQLEW
jgi:hypothetical protein